MSPNEYSIGWDHIFFLRGLHLDANNFDNLLGMFSCIPGMYCFVTSLTFFICVSGIPASMAEVAVPIQKLCVL